MYIVRMISLNSLLVTSCTCSFSDSGGKPGGSKTAKKGRKKLVLFSTGGARGAN